MPGRLEGTVVLSVAAASVHRSGARGTRRSSRVGLALELDPAAVELDERLDQAEAQADPPLAELVLARGVVHGVEAGEERLEQVGPLAGLDADALVWTATRTQSGVASGPAAGSGSCPRSGVNLMALTNRFMRMSMQLRRDRPRSAPSAGSTSSSTLWPRASR